MVDASNTLVDSFNPAIAGSTVIQIYSTGLGPVTNQPATGSPAPLNTLAQTTVSPTVEIGGVTANVLFSGLTPGSVGLYQVNAQVPLGTTPGDNRGEESAAARTAARNHVVVPFVCTRGISPGLSDNKRIGISEFLDAHVQRHFAPGLFHKCNAAADHAHSRGPVCFRIVQCRGDQPRARRGRFAARCIHCDNPRSDYWFSTQFQTGGSISAVFSQTGSSVSGTVLFNGSSCSLANVNGTVAGTQLSATGSAGSQSLTLTGTIGSGNTAIQGSYGLSAGPCAPAGDSGTFTLIQSH